MKKNGCEWAAFVNATPFVRVRRVPIASISQNNNNNKENGEIGENIGNATAVSEQRSKILLTRLVPPSILRSPGGNVNGMMNLKRRRGRFNNQYQQYDRDGQMTGMIGLPNSTIVEKAQKRLDEVQDTIQVSLRGGGIKTYFFHSKEKGLFGGMMGKRRSGDPPLRQINLSYGIIDRESVMRKHVSNPRVLAGGLKKWYQTAIHNKIIEPQPRRDHQKLKLSIKRLVKVPKEKVEGKTRKVLSGKGIPSVTTSEWSRNLGNSPRLIIIGDIHGCIDEFRALLKLADFQPGDQVILLGDLVAKGPDSVGVVQLAREINAKSVRGNHDHEVIRWFEAASRGGADAVVSLEHARIARALGNDEHAWLMDSPWFIECPDMNHLFVHAGFIPGVKLNQQNPRLMMNMRSVLDDGTVTAKNVPACAWARLWRGPQTVVFGHDAFRGLQLYDFAKGIDTGCVYGGRLTALLLPENRFVSVPAKRPYVSSKRFRSRQAARRANLRYADVDADDNDLDRFVYGSGVDI